MDEKSKNENDDYIQAYDHKSVEAAILMPNISPIKEVSAVKRYFVHGEIHQSESNSILIFSIVRMK